MQKSAALPPVASLNALCTAAGMLEGKSLSERIAEGGRMFCIDYVAGDLICICIIELTSSLFWSYICTLSPLNADC